MFDFDAALASLDNDLELLLQQMSYFLRDGSSLVEEIRHAIDGRNTRQLERSAHRLKGLLARYSASAAVALADELEQLGQSGDVDRARPHFDRLVPLVNELTDAIRDYMNTLG